MVNRFGSRSVVATMCVHKPSPSVSVSNGRFPCSIFAPFLPMLLLRRYLGVFGVSIAELQLVRHPPQ